ncbi:UDP-N-acetylmuramate dehydrogenase [Arcobacter sp. 15-2]|uniref:UDP-N-acetylmuramate dehydrogenase n=1 Tax=Arcobacter sp. 15-2 TaxID=3374109 RepID=UPI00399CFAA4
MIKTIDFKKYTSIHIGSTHEVKVIEEVGEYSKYKILGRGNNTLVSNTPPPLAVLGENFDYIKEENGFLVVGAATTSGKLLRYCKKNDIAHFELLAKLPGNLGGLVKMNAGLKKWEIFNYLHSIKTYKGIVLKDNIEYSYRHTKIDGIIYEVRFYIEKGYNKEQQKLFNTMRDNQPNLPSAGSCFKNPKEYSAGYLIENVGLKGYKIGNMSFSSEHANFLVNLNGGSFEEAMSLIQLAQKKVKEKFDIELELEIEIV